MENQPSLITYIALSEAKIINPMDLKYTASQVPILTTNHSKPQQRCINKCFSKCAEYSLINNVALKLHFIGNEISDDEIREMNFTYNQRSAYFQLFKITTAG